MFATTWLRVFVMLMAVRHASVGPLPPWRLIFILTNALSRAPAECMRGARTRGTWDILFSHIFCIDLEDL